jgi:hypothetical protein
LRTILVYPRKTVQEFSVPDRIHMPEVLPTEEPIVPEQEGAKNEQ